jgi:hypothetical protein
LSFGQIVKIGQQPINLRAGYYDTSSTPTFPVSDPAPAAVPVSEVIRQSSCAIDLRRRPTFIPEAALRMTTGRPPTRRD